MTEAEAVASAAQQQFADHMHDFARLGPKYIHDYAASQISGPRNQLTCARGMHPLLAKLARELIAEELTMTRRMGRAA